VLVVAWPAAVFKLSLVKAWLFMAYLALGRTSAWGEVGFFESWGSRLADSPVEWVLVAAGLVIFLVKRPKLRAAVPAMLVGVLMLASVLRVVSTDYRYTTMYFPAFELVAAMSLAHVLVRARRVAAYVLAVAACIALLWSSEGHFKIASRETDRAAWAMIDFVRSENLGTRRMLVPQSTVPVLHFYFPEAVLRGYETEQEAAALSAAGKFDGVLSSTPQWRFRPL
jgi:uncharacterized membrane protein